MKVYSQSIGLRDFLVFEGQEVCPVDLITRINLQHIDFAVSREPSVAIYLGGAHPHILFVGQEAEAVRQFFQSRDNHE